MSYLRKKKSFEGANPILPIDRPHIMDYGSGCDWTLEQPKANRYSGNIDLGVMLPLKGSTKVMHVEIADNGLVRVHVKDQAGEWPAPLRGWQAVWDINALEELEMSKLAK